MRMGRNPALLSRELGADPADFFTVLEEAVNQERVGLRVTLAPKGPVFDGHDHDVNVGCQAAR